MAIFDWFKSKSTQDTENSIMTKRRAPFTVDMTENIKINGELTRGILKNTYPGFKLAGSLAYAAINTPVSIMGTPIPITTDERAKKILSDWVQKMVVKFDDVHASSHGDGTIWVWPFFNSSTMDVDLELIIDDRISDVISDIDTGELLEVISSEQLTIQSEYGKSKTMTRIRSWKKDIIRDTRDGITTITKNPLGIMPVPFSNEPDIGRKRGHSDLERIAPDLKAYHDVKLQWVTLLSKFKPFLEQKTDNVDSWIENQSFSIGDLDIQNLDFVVNGEKESSKYVSLTGSGAEYEKLLSVIFYAICQGSSIPEIAYGLVTTGNHASAEEQMERLMSYCRKKQKQHTDKWAQVFRSALALLLKSNMLALPVDIEVKWNLLDALSEKSKSEIFEKVGNAVDKLTAAGIPGPIIHNQLKAFYPSSTMESYEEFRALRQDAAKFKQFKEASYLDAQSAGGQE
jgi:hypothetical protein